MKPQDTLQRFLFEQHSVRGEMVRLSDVAQSLLQSHDYEPALQQLILEAVATALLMSATLKIKGKLSVQFQGKGPLSLLYAEANHERNVRATAKVNQSLAGLDFNTIFSDGHLVVTIEPEKGERYQGIVPVEGTCLGSCFEHYFARSEQLPTRLFLFANQEAVYGLFLQQLPGCEDDDQWQHLCILAETVKQEEFAALDNEQILQRLFAEETIRLFDTEAVVNHCSCSRLRCERALLTLNADDVRQIVKESGGQFAMTCEFCNTTYSLDEMAVERLLKTRFPSGEAPHSRQ